MSDYIVSARKYRPSTFKTVVGQKHLTNTLKNAIERGQIAQAYLFCGPRGVGKTTCARIFAKTINCLNPRPDGEACGECESCVSVDRGNSYNVIELDAASNNSVNDIRSLTEDVQIPPQIGNYRVFIIDEVHMLSSSAFNAFLKTLEEPPKYAIFILATTEKHKVIPTILSRCQIYDFKRITTGDIVEQLQYVAGNEGVEASAEALNVIARKADGGMRDALSIFDQVVASTLGKVTYDAVLANLNVLDYDYYFKLVESFRAGDVASALLIYNQILERGFDNVFFINGLGSHIRDLLVAADTKTSTLLEVAEEVVEKYTAQARTLPLEWYYAALKIVNDTDFNYRTATNKQMLVELMLIRLCQLLNPPVPPFDRVDNEPPLKMPEKITGNIPVQSPTPATEKIKSQSNEGTGSDSVDSVKSINKMESASSMVSTSPKKEVTKDSKAKKTSGRMRLSDLEAEYEKKSEKKGDRRNAISDQALTKAWTDFINANKEKGILVSAMKESIPVKTGDDEYTVKVAHPAQQQAFLTNMKSLLASLRDSVENDFLSLKVEIDTTIEIKKPMPAKELFQDIVQNNKSIGEMARQLDVEII